MEEARKQAYRVVLSAALLHLKWDLASWHRGLDWFSPLQMFFQSRRARRAARRAVAFHNLAICAAEDFVRFSEAMFWEDVTAFRRDYPDDPCDYRVVFDRCLRGEPVAIIAPSGIGGAAGPFVAAERGSNSNSPGV